MKASNLINEKEASIMLGIKVQTMRNWRFLGHGPAYIKLSNRAVRYYVHDIEHYINERRIIPEA